LSVAITQAAPARALLEQLIDARARDLDDAPVETMADFEAYARDTSGGLIRAAAQMIGAPETDAGIQAATDIGIAYALIGQVRALPFSLPARRVMLPQAVFADGGAGPEVLEAARPDPSITAACGKFLDRAADLLRDARARRADVPGQAAPAFQAARLCRSYLNQLRRCRGDPFDGRLLTPPVWRALSVGFGAKTGRW
jgi:phytoene synthase